jgi:hypothetical protein
MINSDQFNENNFAKKCKNLKAFWTDLKNLVICEYNSTVEIVPDLLADFNRRHPGINRY